MTQQANAVAVRENPALAPAVEVYDRISAVRSVLAPDLNDAELSLFALVAQRSGLDPFTKQIHAVKRDGRVTFQTGIDGYRSIAERTGEYRGVTEPEFGPIVEDARGRHPEWARVGVKREGRDTQYATAYWDEFVPAPGASGKGDAMWRKMPRNQLAKCGEALAFRKQFPHIFGDVYTDDEMHQADSRAAEEAQAARVAAIPDPRSRIAARRAQLEQAAPIATPVAEAAEVASAPSAETARDAAASGSGVPAPAPDPAPEAAQPVEEAVATAVCGAPSPYEGSSDFCRLAPDHKRTHKGEGPETW